VTAARFTSRELGVAAAFIGMLLVSLDSYIVRAAEVDGWVVAFWYGVFSSLTMASALLVTHKLSVTQVVRSGGVPLAASGLLQMVSTTAFVLAIGRTAVSNVVVIVAAAPVLAALMATVAMKERSSSRIWTAIGLSMVGILIVVSGSLGGGHIRGDLLALLAILAFAANLNIWRRFPHMSRTAAIGLAGAFIAVVAAIPADILGHPTRAYLMLAVMGIVSGPLGRVLIAVATRHLPAAEVSLFTPVETIAASLWAWLAFSEAPPLATWIGGAVVISAVIYGTLAEAGRTRGRQIETG